MFFKNRKLLKQVGVVIVVVIVLSLLLSAVAPYL